MLSFSTYKRLIIFPQSLTVDQTRKFFFWRNFYTLARHSEIDGKSWREKKHSDQAHGLDLFLTSFMYPTVNMLIFISEVEHI